MEGYVSEGFEIHLFDEEVMNEVKCIHKSPRMSCPGRHILGQLLACEPTVTLVYRVMD